MTLVSQTKNRDCAGVGKQIRKIREAKGLSQDDLADRLGTSRKQVSRHENGENEMGVVVFFQYCEALGVDANALAPAWAQENISQKEWQLLSFTQNMCEEDLDILLMTAKRFHDHQQ